jgi:ABC-type ATPase involved in cell division
MILLDRVSKKYGKKGVALDKVSFFIEPKEFVVLVGSSGAGKSTILKLLTREERETSGKIVVGGVDYADLREKDIPLKILNFCRSEQFLKTLLLQWKSSGWAIRKLRILYLRLLN